MQIFLQFRSIHALINGALLYLKSDFSLIRCWKRNLYLKRKLEVWGNVYQMNALFKKFLLEDNWFTLLCYFLLYSKVSALFKKFLLEDSWFTLLCYFLLYGKVNQLYIYMYQLFFRFFSHVGHYRVLSRVPCAIQ